MKKRTMTDLLPMPCEGVFRAIFGRLSTSRPRSRPRGMSSSSGLCLVVILSTLIWPASAPAQATNPPPVHSFEVEQSSNAAEGDADELILTDWFNLPDESSPSNQSPMPSLPPGAAPAASAPTADPGPPAGPPLVNIPAIPAPAESRSLRAPVEPQTASPAQAPPSAPVQAPAEIAPSTHQVPAGFTPLPTVPLQPTSQPGPDPFALPPTSEPEAAYPDTTSPAPTENRRTVPLGQKQTVPDPQWSNSDPETTPSQSQVISGAPLPQFDSSQSPWIQLEIGQGDGSGQTPPATSRPTSVYSLPDPAAKPLTPAPAASPGEAQMDAATDKALDQAISQPPAAAGGSLDTPAGRERLRNLFSDMMPPESEGARAPVVNPPAPPASTLPLPDSVYSPPGPAAKPQARPRESDQAVPDRDNVGSSSILRAGELLNLDDYVGAAEILPPLSGRPRQPATETPAKSAPVVVKPSPKSVSPKPEPQVATPPVKTAPAKTAPKPAAKSAPSKAAGAGNAKKGASKKTGGAPAVSPAPAGLGLIIINETGRDRVGQQYRSVLAQMGYKVVSVGEGQPGRGAMGQTVINYRPGLKAKAQAVARHLPGKKVLVEAKKGQVLASEIMIYIR